MKPFISFVKKEWLENVRSYRLLILTCIFVGLGCLSVFSAKFLPELLQSFMPEGVYIELQKPSVYDAWIQFFKNITQIGLIGFVIMCSSTLSNEIKNKTLIMLLSKGLSRKTIVLAKASIMIIVFTIVYVLSIIVTLLYCFYFWNEGVTNLLWALSMVWVFAVFLICVILLGNVLFTSSYGGLLFCGLIIFVLFIIGLFPFLQDMNPLMLVNDNVTLIQGNMIVQDIAPSIAITLMCSVICLVTACLFFDKKAL